jgi:DNA-directed RNA polymerase specialized sigma24 family protein
MFHSLEETRQELHKLSSDDWRKLLRFARWWVANGDRSKAEDILQEALIRLYTGQRRWRKDITLHQVVCGTVMSLRRERKNGIVIQALMDALLGDEDQHAETLVQQIIESFDGDAFFHRFLQGASEKELMEEFNFTEAQLKKQKREIRKRVVALLDPPEKHG